MPDRKRAHRPTRIVVPQWTETRVRGTPSPPGTPIAVSCILPFEEIKHLLSDRPIARPGDPAPRTAARRRVKRRRA